MKYECLDRISLPLYDEDGRHTEEYGTIEEGTIWELSDSDKLIGGEVRLIRDGQWIEISEETFEEGFYKVE